MKPNDRERTHPPAQCRTCESVVEYKGVSAQGSEMETRHYCIHPITGGLMHPDCAWFVERGTR